MLHCESLFSFSYNDQTFANNLEELYAIITSEDGRTIVY